MTSVAPAVVAPLGLPAGLEFTPLEAIVIPQRGPGGLAAFELADLRWSGSSVRLLVHFRVPLHSRDVARLKARLEAVIDERRRRQQATGKVPDVVLPALITDAATPRLIDACAGSNVALLDQRGTVIVHGGGAYIHTIGEGQVSRPSRARTFAGKGCRIVRLLLSEPATAHLGLELSKRSETSYGYTHAVLTRLEQEGYVTRSSPRSGFRTKDPAGLLRAWIESGERTAVAVEAFNAPATTTEALARADAARRAAGISGLFALAGALLPNEVHVSGLPHGMYLGGDIAPVVEALGLRRITPHNFLILHAEPAAESPAGGIYLSPRTLPHGQGVALPQLVVDFARAAGRGPEQAEYLLERYAAALPYSGEPP
jgi:hypothetical protein